jgi:hypothetical protein
MLDKSCKSMGKLWFNSNRTGVARGVGTAYPSGAIECIPVFSGFILFNLKYQQYQTATLLCDVFKEIITVHQ